VSDLAEHAISSGLRTVCVDSGQVTPVATIPELVARAEAPVGRRAGGRQWRPDLDLCRFWATLSRRFAAGLVAGGIEPGERVAIWAPNSPEWIAAYLGLVQTGAVLVRSTLGGRALKRPASCARSRARAIVTVT